MAAVRINTKAENSIGFKSTPEGLAKYLKRGEKEMEDFLKLGYRPGTD